MKLKQAGKPLDNFMMEIMNRQTKIYLGEINGNCIILESVVQNLFEKCSSSRSLSDISLRHTDYGCHGIRHHRLIR